MCMHNVYVSIPLEITSLHSSILTQSSIQFLNFKIKENMEAIQTWVSQHKLTTIGTVWASAIGASLAFSRTSTPLKPSLRLIHARMHAQAFTLAVLSGAAVYHYFDKRGDKLEPEEDHY